MLPPKIIEGTNPSNLAANPDSNAPISFDEPINILFTDDTLPRMSSGVNNCTIVVLITTLILSNAPPKAKKKIDK